MKIDISLSQLVLSSQLSAEPEQNSSIIIQKQAVKYFPFFTSQGISLTSFLKKQMTTELIKNVSLIMAENQARSTCKPHYNYQNFAPFRNENIPITNPIIKMGVTHASRPAHSNCTK